MEELLVLSLRTQESTRNCLHEWLSRRSGKLCSIAVTVPPHNSLPQSIGRDWTRLQQSTDTLTVDSQVVGPNPQRRACKLLVPWWSRPILMPGSHLMAMQIGCTSLTRRGLAPCKIEYLHPTLPSSQNAPTVPSWSRSMRLWS